MAQINLSKYNFRVFCNSLISLDFTISTGSMHDIAISKKSSGFLLYARSTFII